jgi:Zn-dependent alcohol dehydrogenase
MMKDGILHYYVTKIVCILLAVLIGMPAKQMTIDPGLFMYHQRTYRGSLGATYPEKDFPMYLRWYEEGKFRLDEMVTRRYRLEDIN